MALIEVVALPHLNAVKYVVTSIDHSFAIFVFKWTACVYPSQMLQVENGKGL